MIVTIRLIRVIAINDNKLSKALDFEKWNLYDWNNEMTKNIRDLNMNKKTLLSVCLATLLGLPACTFQATNTPRPVAQNPSVCPGGNCPADPFVNYTQTRADFREYGELSPRDQRISQSGAGNNLSAAIPPSIDNEVITYEEQIESKKGAVEDPSTDSESKETQSPETIQEDVTIEEKVVENDNSGQEDPIQDWYAEEGQNLKSLLTKWSEESGWRLVWNTNRNYVLSAGAMFRGRFADVSSALIRAFARARPAPVATFYKGNRVLVVETMEDENAYD